MKVLVLGGGGREHALCEMVKMSPLLSELWSSSANAGMDNRSLGLENVDEIVKKSLQIGIDLVIAGGEVLLVEGIGDRFRQEGIAFAGPTAAMARLESSKGFAKDFCRQYGIATPRAVQCKSEGEALSELENWQAPQVVVKVDGLAGGKGVMVCESKDEAKQAIRSILGKEKKFGVAGQTVLLEEKIEGEEMSFFVLCDGDNAHFVGTAKDYKRAYDGDAGPNTGGMGVVSPSPLENEAVVKEVMDRFVEPTLSGMKARGCPYEGVLFLGMMLTKDKGWQLLEYNVRFGDPECQAMAMRVEGGMLESLYQMATRDFTEQNQLKMSSDQAVVVVVAREGYPDAVGADIRMEGLEQMAGFEKEQSFVFHAGTRRGEDGFVYTSGGRVLGLASRSSSLIDARREVYAMAAKLDWHGGFYRRDIGGCS